MKYDIAFLSEIIPKEIENSVRAKSVSRMEDAAVAWQMHIIDGIEKCNEGTVKMINILPIESYPARYKDAFVKRSEFKHNSDSNDINVGFCNIKIIKRIFQKFPLFNEIEKWAKRKNGKKKVLIAYTMYPEFMNAIKYVKSKWPDIITLAIVVDLPQYIILSEQPVSLSGNIYQKWSKSQAYNNLLSIDGFAVITKQMAELLCKKKPYKIIEGISTEEFPALKENADGRIKVIYAGLLHKKFGIIKLLDAFSYIKDDDFQLIICGIGEAEEEIRKRTAKDKRIDFLGQLKREQVLDIMSSCNVIVNPRENVGEFTKYSFPSKNLEALSSGIPFVGYKLAGIPDEYDSYINYPSDDSPQALAECIYSAGKKSRSAAVEKAACAKKWVKENKCPEKQGEKIIRLIDYINKHS